MIIIFFYAGDVMRTGVTQIQKKYVLKFNFSVELNERLANA